MYVALTFLPSTILFTLPIVLSCGTTELKIFFENVSMNAVYTSQGAVVDFMDALGTWVEESERLQKASVFSFLTDKCTDITAVDELSVFCLRELFTPTITSPTFTK